MVNNPNRFFVIARMDVRYRNPVPVSVPLEAVGWLLKRRTRCTKARAEIFTEGKGILAEARIFVHRHAT